MIESLARLGYMQGRLSAQVDGKIQAFPWAHWRDEFPVAGKLGLALLEWTLDHDRLYDNPLLTADGRREIAALSRAHHVRVVAMTGDLFMQAPFWKAEGAARTQRLAELDAVLQACGDADVGIIVVPLVDGGRIETAAQEADVRGSLLARAESLRTLGLRIAFESDYEPERLAAFMAGFPADAFGVNYDCGNSAALGYDCGQEMSAYRDRVVHVHIKDRVRGGTTVPLGRGDADLPRTVGLLERGGYRGNYVLQTARAADGDHEGALARYRDMTVQWIADAA